MNPLVEISGQECLKNLSKHQAARKRKLASDKDFAFSVLTELVATERHGWDRCLEILTIDELSLLDRFMEDEVRSFGYRPFPRSFVIDPNDADLVEERRCELEPRYRAINDLIASRLRALG